MVYLLSLALIVVFAGFAPPKYGLQQNNYKNYMILCGVLIAVISALRSPFAGSGDSYSYVIKYLGMQTYDSFQEYYDIHLSKYDLLSSEAGFYFSMWLLGHVFQNGQAVIIVSSLFITWATCRFIRRNSVDAALSLTIYVCLTLFTFNLNGMRQAIAMSICLFAYEKAKQRELIKFVLLVVLAMLFHKTAMCFLPVFFLPKLKNSMGYWLFYVIGLILCLLFVDRIIAGYYEISGEDYSNNSVSSSGGLFVILLYVGAIALTLYRPIILDDATSRTALFAVLASFVAYLARFVGSTILERVSYYYYYFMLLLIPAAIQQLQGKEYKIIKILFIACAFFLFVYRIWNGGFRDFTFYFW